MTGERRGVLYPAALPSFGRLLPTEPVANLVRWFWIPEWDIAPGRTARQELIAFPASNLVVEPDLVGLAGPTTRRSFRDLTGRGWAVGALLRPAAVPWLTTDPAALRDDYQRMDLPELYRAVATAMSADDADVRRTRAVAAYSAWLTATVPAVHESGLLANAMAELMDTDPTVLRVGDAAERLGMSVRTMQRLTKKYVGLPPAAMIRRRRLQEAAQRMREDPDIGLASVAADLGYTDQAHLSQDFRDVLGFTPSSYRTHTAALRQQLP